MAQKTMKARKLIKLLNNIQVKKPTIARILTTLLVNKPPTKTPKKTSTVKRQRNCAKEKK
jgi:hypothetical protein